MVPPVSLHMDVKMHPCYTHIVDATPAGQDVSRRRKRIYERELIYATAQAALRERRSWGYASMLRFSFFIFLYRVVRSMPISSEALAMLR